VSDEFEEEPLDPSLPIPKGAEARAVLEALLFAATTPLSLKRLSRLMNGVDPLAVRELLDEMQMEYAREGRGVVLMEVAGGFQQGTRPEPGRLDLPPAPPPQKKPA
jgi:chromosome segregation and condensation protein ScpB